jgi:hypothetical protein
VKETADLEPCDHLEPDGADYPAGTYRVVGRPDGSVTLLRVTDGDGSRANTGEVVHVPREDLGGFERAADPDAGFTPGRWLRNALDGAIQEVRMLLPW